MGYSLRKRYKVDYSTNRAPVYTELPKEEKLSINSKHLDKVATVFPRKSQDELKKIYGEEQQRPDIALDSTEDSEESEEEEEGLTDEQLKQTRGYQLLVKCLQNMA